MFVLATEEKELWEGFEDKAFPYIPVSAWIYLCLNGDNDVCLSVFPTLILEKIKTCILKRQLNRLYIDR